MTEIKILKKKQSYLSYRVSHILDYLHLKHQNTHIIAFSAKKFCICPIKFFKMIYVS